MVRTDSRVPAYAGREALAVSRRSEPTGLSPATPLLENRVTWGSFGSAGEWRSTRVVPSGGGWLKFEVAGQLGTEGADLELRSAPALDLLARVIPNHVPGAGLARSLRADAEP